MDMPASFSGGHDSRAFLSISVCLGLRPFFFPSSGAVRLAVGGGTGGGENVVSDTCQMGFLWESFAVCWGGEGRVFVVALGTGWCRGIGCLGNAVM